MLHNHAAVIISHQNKWRGNYYLTRDLTFTTDIFEACIWVIAADDATKVITNESLVTLSTNGSWISINDNGTIRLDNYNPYLFTIVDGTSDLRELPMDTPVHFVSDKEKKTTLRWAIDVHHTGHNPNRNFRLINDAYNQLTGPTTFMLLPASAVISQKEYITEQNRLKLSNGTENSEDVFNSLMRIVNSNPRLSIIVLLMSLFILIVLISSGNIPVTAATG